MAKLVKAVHVKDPDRHRMVLLLPGEEPDSRLAAQITNPDAWEDGVLPAQDSSAEPQGPQDDAPPADPSGDDPSDDGDEAASAAKKTAARKTAARKPARGRDAAEQGDSGA